MQSSITTNIFLILWLICIIEETTSKTTTNKYKLPPLFRAEFYRTKHYNIHHVLRRKPKQTFRSPILNYQPAKLKPLYGPPSQQINSNHFIHICNSAEHVLPSLPQTIKEFNSPIQEEYEIHLPKTPVEEQFAINEQITELFPHESNNFNFNNPSFNHENLPKDFENFKQVESIEIIPEKQENGYEYVEVPDVYNPPLEYDKSKSTYDTPGAVTSYGTPVSHSQSLPKPLNHQTIPPEKTNIEDYFVIELKRQRLDRANNGRKLHNHRRDRQLDLAISSTLKTNVSSPSVPKSESSKTGKGTSGKHPNHKYE